MNAVDKTRQQFSCVFLPKRLHLFGTKSGYPDFCDPDRQVGDGFDFGDLLRPVADLPKIPIKGNPCTAIASMVSRAPCLFSVWIK